MISKHIYIVGDVQGCCDQLEELHQLILKQDQKAQLFIAGDLVNRGPQSLATLRKLVAMGNKANSILGNHDLSLLGVVYAGHHSHDDSFIRPILDAPDREQLLDWLRHRPLAVQFDQHLLVHAGVLPSWTVQKTLEYAHEVEAILQGPHYVDFLRVMYGNQPTQWSPQLKGMERLRCIVNVLTRLRFCTANDEMEFKSKEGLDKTPPGYKAWFDLPRLTESTTVIFGHWSALGLHMQPNLIGLDTGCVWGGKLTAMRLSDRQLFQVDCKQHRKTS
jgi:bis(5'-nucleosyl)-tetraphosphatase (symmetrical)